MPASVWRVLYKIGRLLERTTVIKILKLFICYSFWPINIGQLWIRTLLGDEFIKHLDTDFMLCVYR